MRHFGPILLTMIVIGGNPLLAQNSIVQEIHLDATAVLDVGSGSLTANFITMAADSSGYSQLIGDVSGFVRMESYLAPSLGPRFNLAFPLDSNLEGVKIDGQLLSTLSNGHPDSVNVYYYDAATTNGLTNRGTWTKTSDLNVSAFGSGYSVYLDSASLGFSPLKVVANGQRVSNGPHIITTDYGGAGGRFNQGWNFIPNPYPSSISWAETRNLNQHLSPSYYVHNGDSSFSAYNGLLSTARPNDSLLSDFIAPMQSFFVQIRNPGDITFDNSVRRVFENPPKFKSLPLYIKIRAINSSTGFKDEFYLGLSTDFTDTLDPEFDGYKMFNEGSRQHNIYSRINASPYVFLGLNDKFSSLIVPVNFDFNGSGTFQLDALLNDVPLDWTVEIEDRSNSQMYDLRNKGFSFSQTSGPNSQRFFLHINKNDISLSQSEDSEIYTYVDGKKTFLKIPEELLSENLDLYIMDAAGRKMKVAENLEASISEIPDAGPHGFYTLVLMKRREVIFSEKLLR